MWVRKATEWAAGAKLYLHKGPEVLLWKIDQGVSRGSRKSANILLNISCVSAQKEILCVEIIQNTIPPFRSLPVGGDVLKEPHYENENELNSREQKRLFLAAGSKEEFCNR